MIVNDHGDYYEFIPQHEHARLSYDIIKKWGDTQLRDDPFYMPLLTAVRHHDRAWIPLDRYPLMDHNKNQPYAFTDYPEKEKLKAYQRGIQEVQNFHPYSGLLVSMHYSSFLKGSNSERGKSFIEEENKRQKQLFEKISASDERVVYHFRLLQFCDDLSLYACMNTPGVEKEEELEWFQHGFRHEFSFLHNRKVCPTFLTEKRITLAPFPLSEPVEAQVVGKKVWKEQINEDGVRASYLNGDKTIRTFTFIDGEQKTSLE